jgi:hypothetical protein
MWLRSNGRSAKGDVGRVRSGAGGRGRGWRLPACTHAGYTGREEARGKFLWVQNEATAAAGRAVAQVPRQGRDAARFAARYASSGRLK